MKSFLCHFGPRRLRLLGLLLLPLLLLAGLWKVGQPDSRPHPMTKYSVPSFEPGPPGYIVTLSKDLDNGKGIITRETVLNESTGVVASVRDDHLFTTYWARPHLQAWSSRGDRAVLPSKESWVDPPYPIGPSSSTNWLRLVYSNGQTRVLKTLPRLGDVCDLRFSPSGGELWILDASHFWCYDLASGRPSSVTRRAESRSSHSAVPATWVASHWGQESNFQAALSPDGKYIAGYDGQLDLFDANTGQLARKFPLPPKRRDSYNFSFHARWIGDGQYLLLEGGWPECLCLRVSDGHLVRTSAWPTRLPRTLSANNTFYADADPDDIILRDTVTGRTVRRARNALQNSFPPDQILIGRNAEAIYFRPSRDSATNPTPDYRLWRWPMTPE